MLDTGACPRCQSADVTLSKTRKLLDYLMRLLNRTAYRCRECRSRFYLPTAYKERIQAQSRWLHPSQRSKRRSRNHSASA